MKLLAKALFVFTVAMTAWSHAYAQTSTARSTEKTINQPTFVDQAKRYAAWKVASMLGDRNLLALLEKDFAANGKVVPLNSLLAEYGAWGVQAKNSAKALQSLDLQVRQQKAIANDSQSLLELRLYKPERYVGRIDWQNLVVAYPPAGKRKRWTTVEAFDRHGVSYRLDAHTPPSVPVLIVGIDRREDLRAGVTVMNRALQAAGLQTIASRSSDSIPDALSPIYASKLDRIRLTNDAESWVSGAAEIYAIVSGVQPNQAKAALTIVDMPYLDYDNITYSPNQLLVIWNDYRYAAANVQLFEHDDNTSYKDLAIVLAQSVTSILGAFAPTYAVIGQVASAILQAMPANWFSNDDDYVDSFYTLERGKTYLNRMGAAKNAVMSLSPIRIKLQ